jgi:hypothetical protein
MDIGSIKQLINVFKLVLVVTGIFKIMDPATIAQLATNMKIMNVFKMLNAIKGNISL